MTAVRENEIGRCHCPVCRSDRARLRVSGKSLAYITCDACNVQVFARSDRSDEKLRTLHLAEPAKPPAEAPPVFTKPMQTAAPSPVVVPHHLPAPKVAMGWGLLG